MRIDMIYFPTDFFTNPPADVDVEASGQTFVAQVRDVLAHEFPDARVNVRYNPTAVTSEGEFEIHWDAGEVEHHERSERERAVRDRVADLVGRIRAGDEWIVRDMNRAR